MNFFISVTDMGLNERNEKIEAEKIFIFYENGGKEKDILIEELEKVDKELKEVQAEEMRLILKTSDLESNKDTLQHRLDSLKKGKNRESKQQLYNLNREDWIEILDDFIQYKDYFENPPEEAYVVDDWDYCRCREAKEVEQLLYKYEIYDTKYIDKLPIMKIRYKKNTPAGFSREKLKLDEILVVLTWLHREERWCGGAFYKAIKNKTFYYILKRMEEIRNEL